MVANLGTERVLSVRHWTPTQFTFTTTRDPGLRFENGQFLMVGLAGESRPLLRAYSIASANHEEHLEFLSIKVPGGPLTSRLQHIRPGDELIISRATGAAAGGPQPRPAAVPAEHRYRGGTVHESIKDPQTYERFAQVVLVPWRALRQRKPGDPQPDRVAARARVSGPEVRAKLCTTRA